MILEINDNILMTEAEVRLELAVILFDKKGITLHQAADIARLTVEAFTLILRERHILPKQPTKIVRTWTPVSLNMGKFPTDLTAFAVQPTHISALVELFENEPSAEELCKML